MGNLSVTQFSTTPPSFLRGKRTNRSFAPKTIDCCCFAISVCTCSHSFASVSIKILEIECRIVLDLIGVDLARKLSKHSKMYFFFLYVDRVSLVTANDDNLYEEKRRSFANFNCLLLDFIYAPHINCTAWMVSNISFETENNVSPFLRLIPLRREVRPGTYARYDKHEKTL